MLVALIGHLACFMCDRLLSYMPNGRFSFGDLKDNEKLSKLFDGANKNQFVLSMLLGIAAIAMYSCGYVALACSVYDTSPVYTYIMLPAAIVFLSMGVAHHVFCGAVEWFYVRFNRTEEARKGILEFFKATSLTMYACYLGLVVLSVAWFVAVISGAIGLPKWCCVFNILPIFAVLAPFRIVGTGNLAGAIMFLGLLIFA